MNKKHIVLGYLMDSDFVSTINNLGNLKFHLEMYLESWAPETEKTILEELETTGFFALGANYIKIFLITAKLKKELFK